MFNRNWSSSYTFEDRYDLTGVNDRVIEYAKKNNKKYLDILDVGCSSGIAMKDLQNKLKEKGIVVKTAGVDPSHRIKNDADKNLDRFISGDILKVKAEPEFDVVVCSKMVLFVSPKLRSDIISKCAEFLKENGGLVTDANCYEFTTAIQDIQTWIKDYQKVLTQIQHGPVMLYKIIREIQSMRVKRKMFLIESRKGVERYSKEILDGYNSLSISKKFDVHVSNLTARLSGMINRRPIRKKQW